MSPSRTRNGSPGVAGAPEEDGMTATDDRRRGPRRTMTDESAWERVVEQARAAGMPVSRFIVERAIEPGARDGGAG